LQNVILGPLRLCMLQWGPIAPARMARGLIAAARADLEGQELWLTHSWEVVAWEITHLRSCHLRKYPWEVALGKLPLGK